MNRGFHSDSLSNRAHEIDTVYTDFYWANSLLVENAVIPYYEEILDGTLLDVRIKREPDNPPQN